MSREREEVNKDIARQFDLPERQSKIATLLKQNDTLYCICRSSDSTRFMIACDNCEEWFHGDCVEISEPESKHIKRYFCPLCIHNHPNLKIVYKKSSKKRRGHHHHGEKSSSSGRRRRRLISSSSEEDLKEFKYDSPPEEHEDKDHTEKSTKSDEASFKVTKKPATVLTSRSNRNEEEFSSSRSSRHSRLSDSHHRKGKTKRKGKHGDFSWYPSRGGGGGPSEPSDFSDDNTDSKQCIGPGCCEVARRRSDYCSDNCGIRMAHTRFYMFLPPRLEEWKYPSVAEQHNLRDLEEIRVKIKKSQDVLEGLDSQRQKLEDHIEAISKLQADPEFEEEEEDGSIYCVSCGHELLLKNALRHMEKCFAKYESQSSFGSIYKTSVEGIPIFCDFYSESQGTYCKRLKVLCPEHTKSRKVSDSEVCGKLLAGSSEAVTKICRNSKKKCTKHHAWEKLEKANIDGERVRQYLKIDECLEQERILKQAVLDRGGVMAIMLHATFDHDLHDRLDRERNEFQRKRLEIMAGELKTDTSKSGVDDTTEKEPRKRPRKQSIN